MKKILVYGCSDAQADAMQIVAEKKDIAMFIVGDSALDETIAKLFEISEDFDTKAVEFPESYLIFQEMDVKELIELLHAFEEDGNPFEGIKVMRTETNQTWTLRNLLAETLQEQKLTKKVMVLEELLKSCNSLDLTEMDPKDRETFKGAMMSAFVILSQGKFNAVDLDRVTQQLSQGLQTAKKLYN